MSTENYGGMTVTSADTIAKKEYEPILEIVEGLLTPGLTILAGAPKVGKSWLSMQLAHAIATGNDFLNKKTIKGDVLYLALEDTERRINSRMRAMFGDSAPANLHFSVCAGTINDGLIQQLNNFITAHQDLKLIIVDTLQVARQAGGTYNQDYRDTGALKSLADEYGIAVVVVHHIRKQTSKNASPFDAIMGSRGITGGSDANIVLERAVLHYQGRDIGEEDMPVRFNKDSLHWELYESEIEIDPAITAIINFIDEAGEWSGNSDDLLDAVPHIHKYASRKNLKRKLEDHQDLLLDKYDIEYKAINNGKARVITLHKVDPYDWLPEDFDWDNVDNYSHDSSTVIIDDKDPFF